MSRLMARAAVQEPAVSCFDGVDAFLCGMAVGITYYNLLAETMHLVSLSFKN